MRHFLALTVLLLVQGYQTAVQRQVSVDQEDVLDLVIDEAYDDFLTQTSTVYQPKSRNFTQVVHGIKTNYGGNDAQNALIFQAVVHGFKDRVFDDLQMSTKIKIKGNLNKMKDAAKDYAKELTKTAWKEFKLVLKHCLDELIKDLKSQAKMITVKFGICVDGKMTDGLEELSEKVDLEDLPMDMEGVQKKIEGCMNVKDEPMVVCMMREIGKVIDVMNTEMQVGDEAKTFIRKLFDDILSCGNFKDMYETASTTIINSPIKCLAGLIFPANGTVTESP